MPKDFSQDGASGAVGGNPATATNTGSSGTDLSSAEQQWINSGYTGVDPQLSADVSTVNSGGTLTPTSYNIGGGKQAYGNFSYSNQATPTNNYQSGGLYFANKANADAYYANQQIPMMFEDGGEVPGGALGNDLDDGSGGDFGDSISQALKTVNDALNYGRQLHGLTQGSQQSSQQGSTQVADSTSPLPRAPASQSDTGIPATRPFPRLDPLPNAFGKRRVSDASGGQSGSDDQASNQQGIPDEEEAA